MQHFDAKVVSRPLTLRCTMLHYAPATSHTDIFFSVSRTIFTLERSKYPERGMLGYLSDEIVESNTFLEFEVSGQFPGVVLFFRAFQ